jgi:hypothetical protein
MTTDHEDLIALKLAAKVFAKGTNVPRHYALDLIAQVCEHAHWNALMKAFDKGWRPSLLDLERAENLLYDVKDGMTPRDTSNDSPMVINGHSCTLTEEFMDVLLWGEHWCIHRGHAPSEPAEVETYGRPCAIDDPEVLAEAMKIVDDAAGRLRARIADDWPRDSMNPDPQGRVTHPLMKTEPSLEWYCLHCDGSFTGMQMVSNMWHCPQCSATPIDIFVTPFWRSAA